MIGSYDNEYDVAHFIVQLTDITNNQYALSEVLLLMIIFLMMDRVILMILSLESLKQHGIGTIGTRITGAAVGVAATMSSFILLQMSKQAKVL